MIHANSMQAHQQNLQFDFYSNMSERIVAKLKELKEATGADIAKALNIEYHKISGRFKTLKETGAIEVVRNEKVGRNNFQVFKVK